MTPSQRVALLGACRHLRIARKELLRGSTWWAVKSTAAAELLLGLYAGLASGDTSPAPRGYAVATRAAVDLWEELGAAFDAAMGIAGEQDYTKLTIGITEMIRVLRTRDGIPVTDWHAEERARNITTLIILDSSYRAIGGRHARAAAVRAGYPARPERLLTEGMTSLAVSRQLQESES
jgi:hypothetical protein